MLPISIKQSDHLTQHEQYALVQLAQICEGYDKYATRLYWEIIKNKRDIPGNLLCYAEHRLIGYLSFFMFDEGAVTIAAIIHPDYRRQTIFLNLLRHASTEINRLGIKKIIFSFNQQSDAAKQSARSLGAQYLESEYRLERYTKELEKEIENILEIRQAISDDVSLLAKIDRDCFNSDYQLMFDRFKNTIFDSNRRAWLAYFNQEYVGKVHILLEDEGAFFHDVCIIPSKQKLGLATQLLKFVVNQLICEQQDRMYLEVPATNIAALRLYERCHFQITDIYENWEMTLP